MSCSQHRIALPSRLRDVHLVRGTDRLVSEAGNRQREQESYRRGFEAGQKSVGEQLVQQRTELHELYHGVLQSMQKVVPDLVRQSEEALFQLVRECVAKILAGVEVSGETVSAVVREALEGLETSSVHSIHLHPQDIELLDRTTGPSALALDKNIQLEADPKVGRGGCIVKTSFGTIDATVATKMARLKGALS